MSESIQKSQKRPPPMKEILAGSGIFILLVIGLIAVLEPALLEDILAPLEGGYLSVLENQEGTHPLFLIGFAFLGGFLGSISPCILAMLPMNLGYIGTLNIENRWDAISKAGAFVAGVVLITSLFGLLSGFAQAVMVVYKGYLFLGVSVLMLLMGVSMLGWLRLPMPSVVTRVPSTGPFVVGIAFALISSPCASPVLFGVLAMAATAENTALSVATMASYGLGYTALIFFASIFTGLSKQVSGLKYHGDLITKISASVLLLAGIWAFYQGISWML